MVDHVQWNIGNDLMMKFCFFPNLKTANVLFKYNLNRLSGIIMCINNKNRKYFFLIFAIFHYLLFAVPKHSLK